MSLFALFVCFILCSNVSSYSSQCGNCVCEYSETVKEALCMGAGYTKVPMDLPVWLERLTLDSNSISELDLYQMQKVYPNLKVISLKKNPICVRKSQIDRVSQLINSIFSLSPQFYCSGSTNSGRSDVDYCRIHHISKN